MSTFAYLDEQRKYEISAEEARNESRDFYFCPNKECEGHLRLVRKNGLSSAYFRCLPNFPHNHDCEYKNGISYARENFDEDAFNLDIFEENIYKNTYKISKNKSTRNMPSKMESPKCNHPPNTVCQLYHIFKSIEPKSTFNGISRESILCDQRSAYLYTQYISGF